MIARGPVGEIHLGGLRRQRVHAGGIHGAEEPGAAQVRGDDLAHRLGLRDIARHRRDRDGDLAPAARREVDGELGVRAEGKGERSEKKEAAIH